MNNIPRASGDIIHKSGTYYRVGSSPQGNHTWIGGDFQVLLCLRMDNTQWCTHQSAHMASTKEKQILFPKLQCSLPYQNHLWKMILDRQDDKVIDF